MSYMIIKSRGPDNAIEVISRTHVAVSLDDSCRYETVVIPPYGMGDLDRTV